MVTTGMLAQNTELSEARRLYQTAADDEKAARGLLELMEHKDTGEPVMLGYKAAGHMMMAKHVGNPFKKMSHFNKGKDVLSKAINADKNNLELRFLRFAVQAEAPGFLGYRGELEEDKQLLLKGAGKIKDPVLRGMVINYLRKSKGLSASEKEMF